MTPRLAADDWGLSRGVNEGIIALAERGWLYSVSCLANGGFIEHGLERLRSFAAVKFSLHFNLTEGRPLGMGVRSLVDSKRVEFLSHKRLIGRVLQGRIEREHIRHEFSAQLNRLKALDMDVSGVDGHHHVHLLPVISDVVESSMAEAGLSRLRLMTDRDHKPSWLQTVAYRRRSSNFYFDYESCQYLRACDVRSSIDFQRKIKRVGDRPLLVHPALYDDFVESSVRDPLREERVFELNRLIKYLET